MHCGKTWVSSLICCLSSQVARNSCHDGRTSPQMRKRNDTRISPINSSDLQTMFFYLKMYVLTGAMNVVQSKSFHLMLSFRILYSFQSFTLFCHDGHIKLDTDYTMLRSIIVLDKPYESLNLHASHLMHVPLQFTLLGDLFIRLFISFFYL